MFFGLMLQSPHDLTAAFPSDARAAVSSCFLCHTHPECLHNQGSRKVLWHFCLLLLVLHISSPALRGKTSEGRMPHWAPPSLPGQHRFLQDRFQHCTPDFRWNFATMLPFWQLGFVSPPSVSATTNCPESLKRNC